MQFRIVDAREYGEPAGYLIEGNGYHGWAVYAWEERGLADLCGVFATREAAQAAIDANT